MRAPPQPLVSSHPLALLAASFALGIILARFIALPLIACLITGAACAAMSVYAQAKQQPTLPTIFVALAFGCAGASLALLETNAVGPSRVQRFYDEGVINSGDPVEVTGVLTNQPERAPDGFYLTLRVETLRSGETLRAASGVVWLFAPVREDGGATRAAYEALELRYGARVRLMTRLSRAESFRNSGVSSLTEYLERRGYDATGIIKSPLLVERLDDERVFLPLAWLYEWRQFLLRQISAKFSNETSGVLQAALLGNRYYLSHDAAERFREAGTFHVLVISGLHISFIGGMALLLMRRLTRRRGWQFIVSAMFLWAYSLAVGAEASVVRAALMFTIVALAPVVSRRAQGLNALGCAALLLLVWRPSELFDASFQLTFLSVLMIIVIAWPLLTKLKETGSWRPTQATPYPPACPRAVRTLAEALFWSEREWQRELARATYSCSLFKTPLAARLERWRVQRILRYAFSAIVISTSVQVGLLPVLILYFHRLSLVSFVLNIFVGALMAALSFVSLAALLLSQLSTQLAAPLFRLAETSNWLMIHSVDPFARLGVAAIRVPEYTGWPTSLYALYYVPLCILTVALSRWNPLNTLSSANEDERAALWHHATRVAALVLVSMLVIIIAHPLSEGLPDGRLRIDFLDVGQGDAALLTMPDGTTLLIDGGGRRNTDARRTAAEEDDGEAIFERDSRSIGEAVVSEYLWWRGLSRVDYILATHAHTDHIDGLKTVAQNFRVRAALVARAPADEPEFASFATTMRTAGVPVYFLGRGDTLRFGAVEADVIWPPGVSAGDTAARSGNNDSIVLRLRFGGRVFLLTGDIEREAEEALAAMEEVLSADVVKVAHHGSRTSSTEKFVALVQPEIAVISVGRSSVFGHPHKEVVERWRASGAQVLTTGKRGNVTVSTDGRDLRVETFVPD
jgi:competence protein ComEC